MDGINVVLTVLAGAFGGGWLLQVLFYRYERRKKAAETASVELDFDMKHDEMRDRQAEKTYGQIVELQGIVDSERDKWIELAKRVVVLKMELLDEREARKTAEFDRCTVAGCDRRVPPRKNKEV